eukprot:CAMPEP_0170549610 /NCGR_PEP_ID=MMETSP0211-20121228/7758_1 /TAXON_ID=311385 /ORGANISM="Pseudokeronopsis sp., Strain OXSARD2" /LENGTH=73 /DNA_ID=CAMNT_0010855719 /DNA_START=814 /DNA_END=1032 /DNA_ORIENTATION=-
MDLSSDGRIIVKFTHLASALSVDDGVIEDCTDVNKNDILGDIYFYNAPFLGFDDHSSYSTLVYYLDGAYNTLG